MRSRPTAESPAIHRSEPVGRPERSRKALEAAQGTMRNIAVALVTVRSSLPSSLRVKRTPILPSWPAKASASERKGPVLPRATNMQ